MAIPVIDVFAGPGGLGEGFSNVEDGNKERVFDIKLSIEKDYYAHQTLLLRSFLRQFPINQFPDEYYMMVRKIDSEKRERLKSKMFSKYAREYSIAEKEAWQCELGNDDFPPEVVDQRISNALEGEHNWLLIGGPPCQAYSLVGRSRNKGISEDDHRVFLYREYLRIIAKHQPAVFVMENVKGLLSAELNGNKIFDWIKADLREPGRVFPNSGSHGYKIYSLVKEPTEYDENNNPLYKNDRDYLIKSELYEIPQKRHRVILLGIRDDISIQPEVLDSSTEISLESVIGDLPRIRSVVGRKLGSKKGKNKKRTYVNIDDNNEVWRSLIQQFRSEISQNMELKGVSLPKESKILLTSVGKHFVRKKKTISTQHRLYNWIYDSKLGGVLNHESRSHLLEDLRRYYFYSVYTKIYSSFPRLKDVANYDSKLLPEHKNALTGVFEDRFRVQMPDSPATTVTSHISKDGHYFIHYDYNQCRSLTVREGARIQTFPDNYFFCGPRTQQFHQIGNAVPPFLANKIGYIVNNIFKNM